MPPGRNGWGRGSRWRRSAHAPWDMRRGRSSRWWWRRRRCTPPRAACSDRPSRRSVSVWSGRLRSASGSDAMPAIHRLATASPPPVMGPCGYLLWSRSVFLVTFILAIPTLLALSRIREREIDIVQAHGAIPREVPDEKATSVFSLIRRRPLLIFAASVLLLQLANAAMLPLMA